MTLTMAHRNKNSILQVSSDEIIMKKNVVFHSYWNTHSVARHETVTHNKTSLNWVKTCYWFLFWLLY